MTSTPDPTYNVEDHWSRVGREIERRSPDNAVAGDDDAFYRYKRKRFLRRFLHTIDFDGKSVLEIGCGPGGNLVEIASHHKPRALSGADISPVMAALAQRNLARRGLKADIHVTDGQHLPFADRSLDLAYTVTVLQHNTNGASCQALVADICRVTADRIVLMEDLGTKGYDGEGSFVARRVDVYEQMVEAHGFKLTACEFLNVYVSRRARMIVGRFLSKGHKEGEPIAPLARVLMASALPFTRIADELLLSRTGLARMTFTRAG